MIQAPQALINYINATTRDSRQYIRVEIIIDQSTTIDISLDEMVNGSLSLNKKAVSSNSFDIGQAYIDSAKFTVDREFIETQYPQGLAGKKVIIYYGVHDLITTGSDVEVVIFTGVVPESGVTRTKFTVDITADSMLSLLNINISSLLEGTPLEFFTYISSITGVGISARLLSWINSNTNAQYTYYITDTSVIKTYRDLAMWLGQILSGSITCNNVGELDIVLYSTDSDVFTLNPDICKSSSVNDEYIYVDSCSLQVDNEELLIVGTQEQVRTLRLTNNILLANIEDTSLRDSIVNKIYEDIHAVPTRSFSYTYNGNPLIELGDRISYNGVSTYVQSLTYGFRKTSKLEGYALDIRYSQSTMSQAVKSASSTGGKAQVNTVACLNYTNIAQQSFRFNEFSNIASVQTYLYENTQLLINVTIVARMGEMNNNLNDHLEVKQTYDNVQLPTVIKVSAANGGYRTITFNTVTPQSEIFDKHTYSLDMAYIEKVVSQSGIAGYIDVQQIEIDMLVVVGLSGSKPAIPPSMDFEDRVVLQYKLGTEDNSRILVDEDSVSTSLS